MTPTSNIALLYNVKCTLDSLEVWHIVTMSTPVEKLEIRAKTATRHQNYAILTGTPN